LRDSGRRLACGDASAGSKSQEGPAAGEVRPSRSWEEGTNWWKYQRFDAFFLAERHFLGKLRSSRAISRFLRKGSNGKADLAARNSPDP
jgi:hypothetical protein